MHPHGYRPAHIVWLWLNDGRVPALHAGGESLASRELKDQVVSSVQDLYLRPSETLYLRPSIATLSRCFWTWETVGVTKYKAASVCWNLELNSYVKRRCSNKMCVCMYVFGLTQQKFCVQFWATSLILLSQCCASSTLYSYWKFWGFIYFGNKRKCKEPWSSLSFHKNCHHNSLCT